MDQPSRSETKLAVVSRPQHPPSNTLWSEPLDTPGFIPRHLKRSATTQFPILEVVQRFIHRFNPVNSNVEKILAIIGLYQAVRPVYHHVTNLFLWAFTAQVTIPEHDPIAKDVLAWMGSNVIRDSLTRSAMLMSGSSQDPNDDFHRRLILPGPRNNFALNQYKDDEVLCLPPIGRTKLFWVGFRPILFSRRGATSSRSGSMNIVDHSGQLQNSITLTTLGWQLKPLQDFTKACHEFQVKNMKGTTTIFFAGGSHADPYNDTWQTISKAIRKLDTIDMDETVKSDIIRDAEYYYSDESRNFFADCGIPYRRGYLFHGPPGTGKSSFSAALAGHLGCNMYHINLATGGMTDDKLHRLFLGLPRKCVVVLEDIDSAGIGREFPGESADSNNVGHFSSEKNLPETMATRRRAGPKQMGNTITLSGLLNAIDGNASQEGRLLIMTSNTPDVLDEALTRPGRIDKKVHFGNMGKMAARSIFMRVIGRCAVAHDAAITMEQIEQSADEFADKLPEHIFSPAHIQNFLQDCRGDPRKAVQDFDDWIKNNRSPRG